MQQQQPALPVLEIYMNGSHSTYTLVASTFIYCDVCEIPCGTEENSGPKSLCSLALHSVWPVVCLFILLPITGLGSEL